MEGCYWVEGGQHAESYHHRVLSTGTCQKKLRSPQKIGLACDNNKGTKTYDEGCSFKEVLRLCTYMIGSVGGEKRYAGRATLAYTNQEICTEKLQVIY